jgi:hypothetical protein
MLALTSATMGMSPIGSLTLFPFPKSQTASCSETLSCGIRRCSRDLEYNVVNVWCHAFHFHYLASDGLGMGEIPVSPNPNRLQSDSLSSSGVHVVR